jgi:predicted amidohydrolase
MIIDPWGKILAQAGDEPCVITAVIDIEQVTARRAQMPVLR